MSAISGFVGLLRRLSGIGYRPPPALSEHAEFHRLNRSDRLFRRAANLACAEARRLDEELKRTEAALR